MSRSSSTLLRDLRAHETADGRHRSLQAIRNQLFHRLCVWKTEKIATAGCAFSVKFAPRPGLLGLTLADKAVLWDYERSRCVLEVKDHTDIVSQILFIQKSRGADSALPSFLTCSLDRSIRLYDNGKCVSHLLDHKDWIRCLALCTDESRMLSGCISSVIYCWDMQTQKPMWNVKNAHDSDKYKDLNSVNALWFMRYNNNAFVSGARDGSCRVWDVRTNAPVASWVAHNAKLNCVQGTADDRVIMTAGRDDSVRLFDVRKLNSGPLTVCSQHKCQGYNVQAILCNSDRHIVTGSEASELVVYDAQNGSLVSKLPFPSTSSVVHLVDCQADGSAVEIVSSTVDNPNFTIWRPSLEKTELNARATPTMPTPPPSTPFAAWRRRTAENLMVEYGDRILTLFHKYNVTFSNNWTDLLQVVMRENNAEAHQMLQEMNELFRRSLEAEIRHERARTVTASSSSTQAPQPPQDDPMDVDSYVEEEEEDDGDYDEEEE